MVHYSKDHTVNGKAVPQLGTKADGTSTQEWNQAIYEFLNALKPVTPAVINADDGSVTTEAKKPVDVLFKAYDHRETDPDTVHLVIKVLSSAVPSSVYNGYLREDGDLEADHRACTEIKLDGFTVQKVDPWKLFRYRMAVCGDVALVGGSADDVEDQILEHQFDSKGTYVDQVTREAQWLIDWRSRMSNVGQTVSAPRLRSYLRTAIKTNLPEVYNVDMLSKDTFAALKQAMLSRANDLDKDKPAKGRAAKAFGAFTRNRNGGNRGSGSKPDGWKEPCRNFAAGRCNKSADECDYYHPKPKKGGRRGKTGGNGNGNGNGKGKGTGDGCWECGSHDHKAAHCPQVPVQHRPTAAVCLSKEEYKAHFSGSTHAGGVGAFKASTRAPVHGAFVAPAATGVHGATQTKQCVLDTATGMWRPFDDSG